MTLFESKRIILTPEMHSGSEALAESKRDLERTSILVSPEGSRLYIELVSKAKTKLV